MAKQRRSKGQGTLFKRNGRGPWIASWFDHDGKRRERSTRTVDKAAAERILSKHVTDAALRRDGVIDGRAETVAGRARRAISEHLVEWKASLEAKGSSSKRVQLAFRRAQCIASDCRFGSLADVEPTAVHRFIRAMQENQAAPRTINGHLQAFGQFIRWAVAERRVASNPLAGVAMVKVIGQTRERRPLSAEEVARLLDAAECGPAYRRMTGEVRAMLYRVAIGTGLRASELASLTRASFDLKADPPAVKVKAASSKRRRDDRQPIRRDLAELLRHWLDGRPGDTPVFNMPDKLAPIVRADLRWAKARWIKETQDRAERRRRRDDGFLAHRDAAGRIVDFHALRVTYITLLVKGGASVKVAQELARHSDPKLTMNVYTRLGVHDLAGALENLPGTTPRRTEDEALRATGTDDAMAEVADASQHDPQLYPQQLGRDRAHRSAAHHNDEHGGVDDVSDRKSLPCAEKRDDARRGAATRVKATSGIRTPDLCFTKAPL